MATLFVSPEFQAPAPAAHMTMREAAYLVGVRRVAEACRLRGWV